MKTALVEQQDVDRLKFLWNKKLILTILYLEDDSYGGKAIQAYIDFNNEFDLIQAKHGIYRGTLSFDTKVLVGEEQIISGDYVSFECLDRFYYELSFYEDCIRRIPVNRINKLDFLLQQMKSASEAYERARSEYPIGEIDFAEKRIYLKR